MAAGGVGGGGSELFAASTAIEGGFVQGASGCSGCVRSTGFVAEPWVSSRDASELAFRTSSGDWETSRPNLDRLREMSSPSGRGISSSTARCSGRNMKLDACDCVRSRFLDAWLMKLAASSNPTAAGNWSIAEPSLVPCSGSANTRETLVAGRCLFGFESEDLHFGDEREERLLEDMEDGEHNEQHA
ncbi:hypothetical protein BD413DRAFT_520382 [Trametes elegans]|nr:hypothetical protein BD413DRAFT_520382 [Trametes elegans]